MKPPEIPEGNPFEPIPFGKHKLVRLPQFPGLVVVNMMGKPVTGPIEDIHLDAFYFLVLRLLTHDWTSEHLPPLWLFSFGEVAAVSLGRSTERWTDALKKQLAGEISDRLTELKGLPLPAQPIEAFQNQDPAGTGLHWEGTFGQIRLSICCDLKSTGNPLLDGRFGVTIANRPRTDAKEQANNPTLVKTPSADVVHVFPFVDLVMGAAYLIGSQITKWFDERLYLPDWTRIASVIAENQPAAVARMSRIGLGPGHSRTVRSTVLSVAQVGSDSDQTSGSASHIENAGTMLAHIIALRDLIRAIGESAAGSTLYPQLLRALAATLQIIEEQMGDAGVKPCEITSGKARQALEADRAALQAEKDDVAKEKERLSASAGELNQLTEALAAQTAALDTRTRELSAREASLATRGRELEAREQAVLRVVAALRTAVAKAVDVNQAIAEFEAASLAVERTLPQL